MLFFIIMMVWIVRSGSFALKESGSYVWIMGLERMWKQPLIHIENVIKCVCAEFCRYSCVHSVPSSVRPTRQHTSPGKACKLMLKPKHKAIETKSIASSRLAGEQCGSNTLDRMSSMTASDIQGMTSWQKNMT